jgi:protein-L-isoaspartate(D-aspartate) O-methyltransferase
MPNAERLMIAFVLQLALTACGSSSRDLQAGGDQVSQPERDRSRMVGDQLRARGIQNEAVLRTMGRLPRERFVPPDMRGRAYDDTALPIGHQQTISQPYIVAFMTQALEPRVTSKVLEIGTGSGYQAAVLASIVHEVYTIEIIPELAAAAERTLSDLGIRNVHVRTGDGYVGWPEAQPFDGIVVTAAPDHVPQPLVDQLAVGGQMAIPVGTDIQELLVISKTASGVIQRRTLDVRFVPLRRQSLAGR